MARSVVVLLWAFLATFPARAELDRAVLMGLGASVLKIEAQRAQGGYSLGSGVVVAPEGVVTNCHVTRDATEVEIVRGGARWRAVSQRRDTAHDLCLLQVPGLLAPVAKLGDTHRLKAGQKLSALGYTGGLTMQYSGGEVVSLHRFEQGRVVQSSNWFSSGASGGGLFDDDLNLVGILTFRARGGESNYFAAPVEWLKQTGNMAPEGIRPDASGQLAYWQRMPDEQPTFLQAARLEGEKRWSELESLAGEWARADATDPEPWYLKGHALDHLDRLPEARRAYECSMAIDPDATAVKSRLEPLDARIRSVPAREHGDSSAARPEGMSALRGDDSCIARPGNKTTQ